MKYSEYVAESKKFAEMFANLPEHERHNLPAHKWMHVMAEVTCETPGCPHGTQLVSFRELCDGQYASWCGHCNTPNTHIVGIFDDGERVKLKARKLLPDDDDPWAMNDEHTAQKALSVN